MLWVYDIVKSLFNVGINYSVSWNFDNFSYTNFTLAAIFIFLWMSLDRYLDKKYKVVKI